MSRGKDLLARQEYSRAALEFRNAIQAVPSDAEAHYQLGLACSGAKQSGEAYYAFRKALELNPNHAQAKLHAALMMSSSGNPETLQQAHQLVTSVLSEQPDDPDALNLLAATDLRLGNRDDAAQALERALRKFPAHLSSSVSLAELMLSRKDIAGAGKVLQQAVDTAPRSADAAAALGEFYFAGQKDSEAEKQARTALAVDSNNGPALVLLAGIQIRRGRLDEAEQSYARLAALPDPSYKPLHAMFLFGTGKRDQAVVEFEKLAKASPGDRDARSRLAAAYLRTGKVAEAQRLFTAVLAKNPVDVDALVGRSYLYLMQEKYQPAENDLNEVLHFRPDFAGAHYALARVHLRRGAVLNGKQELSEALRLDPNLLMARAELARALVGSNAGAAALELMNHTPAEQIGTLPAITARNWALLAVAGYPELRKSLDRGLAQSRVPELLIQDALLRMSLRDYDGARNTAREAIKQEPLRVSAWKVLLDAGAARQQSGAAVGELQSFLAKGTKSAQLEMLLGQALEGQGNRAAARSAYESARTIDPRLTGAGVAIAQIDLADGKAQSARQILSAVVVSSPLNVPAHLLLAGIEKQAGNTEAAAEHYRRVLSVDSGNIVALNNLAYLLLANNPDVALKYAAQAAELAPANAAIQDTLGGVYYSKGMYSLAVQHLKDAVLKDGSAVRKYHLAMAYSKSGEAEMSRRILQEAVHMDPSIATRQGW